MARGHGDLMFNLRLKPDEPRKVSKQEIAAVLRHVINEKEVPSGWSFAGIEWMNPERASKGWQKGTSDDLVKFIPVMKRIGVTNLADSFRAAEVERVVKRTPERERRKLRQERRIAKWGKVRHGALRKLERSKTERTRAKHRKAADRARKRYQDASEKLERLQFEEEPPEYEVAGEYKKKGKR